jgi:hypothetical protein
MPITSTPAEFVYCENDEDNTYLNLFPNCQIRIPKNSSWNTPIYLGDAVLPFCNISIIIDDQEYYPINITNDKNSVTFIFSDSELATPKSVTFTDNMVYFASPYPFKVTTIVTFVLLTVENEGV